MVRWILGLGLLCLPLHTVAWGQRVYHVSPTGSDHAPGTFSAPLRSPQYAVDRATTPGDTIVLNAGRYDTTIRMVTSGNEGAPITLRSAPGARAVVLGGVALRPQAAFPHGTIAWIVLEGLELTGRGGVSMQNAFQVVLRHNYIHHQPNQGISGNGYRIHIEGNRVEYCGPFDRPAAQNLYHGMYFGGTEIHIIRNTFHGNLAFGIQLDGFPFDPSLQPSPRYTGASHWLIEQNTLSHHAHAYGIVVWKPGARQNVIRENTFVENGGGILFQHSGTGNLVVNNRFSQGRAPAIADTAGGASYVTSGTALPPFPASILQEPLPQMPGERPEMSSFSGEVRYDAPSQEPPSFAMTEFRTLLERSRKRMWAIRECLTHTPENAAQCYAIQ